MAENPKKPFVFIFGVGFLMFSFKPQDAAASTFSIHGPSVMVVNKWTIFSCDFCNHIKIAPIIWLRPRDVIYDVIRNESSRDGKTFSFEQEIRDSPYYKDKMTSSNISHLEDIITQFQERNPHASILICGDMNARIGCWDIHGDVDTGAYVDSSFGPESFNISCLTADSPFDTDALETPAILVRVIVPPEHIEITGPTETRGGVPQAWQCHSKGSRPAAELSWLVNGQPIFLNAQSAAHRGHDGYYTVNSSLRFTPVPPMHWANVTCKASMEGINESTTTHFLTKIVYLKFPEGRQELATRTWMAGFASGIILILTTLLCLACCPCVRRHQVPMDSEVESESTDYGDKIEL